MFHPPRYSGPRDDPLTLSPLPLSGPWGNNTHCFNNKGSHTLKTGKYYQDSDNEDRAVSVVPVSAPL